MKLLDMLSNLLKDNRQLSRVVVLMGILLVIGVASFGVYYYVDRYVSPIDDTSPMEKTIGEMEEAVRQDPQNADLRLSLAETYLLNQRYEDALEQALKIYETGPTKDRAMLIIGISYASTGKYEEAIEPLNKFIAIHEQSQMASMDMSLEAALYYLGDCYIQLGRAAEAIQSLRRAVEINRTDADAFYKLGVALSQNGEHVEALDMFERATLFVPNFTEAYQGMVDSYMAINQPTYAAYARGMVAYSLRDYEGARVELEKVIAADDKFALAYIGLGLTYEQMGDLQQAKKYADIAVTLAPDNIAAQQLKGRVDAALK